MHETRKNIKTLDIHASQKDCVRQNVPRKQKVKTD